jgi:hypothetical protein
MSARVLCGAHQACWGLRSLAFQPASLFSIKIEVNLKYFVLKQCLYGATLFRIDKVKLSLMQLHLPRFHTRDSTLHLFVLLLFSSTTSSNLFTSKEF